MIQRRKVLGDITNDYFRIAEHTVVSDTEADLILYFQQKTQICNLGSFASPLTRKSVI